MANRNTSRSKLDAALIDAIDELKVNTGNEKLYAFALYTSGEDDYRYVSASANTEEALMREAAEYAKRDARYKGDVGTKRLRWSAPDWSYHDFSPAVGALELPAGSGARRDKRIYADFLGALKALDEAGNFGKGKQRKDLTLLVLCGDMSEAFFRRSLVQLNPKATVKCYIDEHTADGFFLAIDKLPKAK